jgi:hypothetical protein
MRINQQNLKPFFSSFQSQSIVVYYCNLINRSKINNPQNNNRKSGGKR